MYKGKDLKGTDMRGALRKQKPRIMQMVDTQTNVHQRKNTYHNIDVYKIPNTNFACQFYNVVYNYQIYKSLISFD